MKCQVKPQIACQTGGNLGLADLVRQQEVLDGPQLPGDAERRKEHSGITRALPGAMIGRLLSRPRYPAGERTLWRLLYETVARASQILALNVEDLDLGRRRAPIRSKGGDIEFIYWGRRNRAPAASAACRPD